MKKTLNKFLSAALCGIMTLPMLNSCYDDKALWDKIGNLENRVETLETELNNQLKALEALISEKTTISTCTKNSDGSMKVTLSDGTVFTVLPEGTDFSSLVSVINVNGTKCWATYDSNGKLLVLSDDAGEPVPVINDYRTSVKAVIEDGICYLEIDGKRYQTGYDAEDIIQVFNSCVPHTDMTGNIYAMTFTFGEGVEITVSVDGYNGIIFRIEDGIEHTSVISEYYIGYGETATVIMEMTGVIDYVMQIPDGWRVEDRIDETSGNNVIDITAPNLATIEAEAAVAEGELKVVAVVEGGKAAITKLNVSASPFKVFNISGSKAVIEPYEGVQKYVYGITTADEYDEATLIGTVEELLTSSSTLPAGFGISTEGINLPLSEIYGKALETSKSYIFWAIPALYEDGNDAHYYVNEGTFCTKTIEAISIKIETKKVGLLDADIEMTLNGSEKMFAGTSEYSNTLFEDIIYKVNNGILESMDVVPYYNGLASTFPLADGETVQMQPGTEYVSWIIPVDKDKTSYTKEDLYYTRFKTTDLSDGGSLKITASEPEVTMSSISIPIASEGAEIIYYTYFTKKMGDWYADSSNEEKMTYILDDPDHKMVAGDNATAVVNKIKPSTDMYLFAVAVDKDGKYGEIAMIAATTGKLEYNDIKLTVSTPEISSNKATFKIEATGGTPTEYIYWFGKSTDPFWTTSEHLGATRNNAQEYMAVYPNDHNITMVMNKYGDISSDGTLNVTDLNGNTDYIFMVLAKDESGKWSKGGYKMITTLAVDLGTVVREGSEEWIAAKEHIQIKWLENSFRKAENTNMTSSYSYEFSCPTNFTAYVVSMSEEYYDECEDFITVEDVIIDIEKYASRRYDSSKTPYTVDENGNQVLASDPDWYDDNGVAHEGYLMTISEYYVHGFPYNGFATYFAAGSHDGNHCTSIENGTCANYERALGRIAEKRTYEYYRDYIVRLRGLTNEESIKKSAQALYDAYYPHYANAEPVMYVNDGSPIRISQPYATGPDQSGTVIDDVIVVLKDLEGNYYEPMAFPVPNYFK